ncbi:hypothetical protein C0993_012405 [Termitomyces sp. T159_Od127]|nr:hypothetical protein C0993_012405 [Termitomyces sp. T159_Od127]
MSSDPDAAVLASCEAPPAGAASTKRPTPPVESGAVCEGDGEADAEAEPEAEGDGEERSSSEYESGRVSCDTCGLSVSFRDEATGGFSLKEWQEHKETCGGAGESAAAGAGVGAHAPAKRRRAKRTEEERKAYLGSDPYVERFEAYRVLCKSCDKWIRLRPNSTYCSIPWDAHRKSCLAKKINSKNVYALDERNALFAKDPDVRKFDAERVLCNLCDSWIPLNPDNHLFAVQTWLQHRAACQQARPAPPAPPAPSAEPKPKPDPATRPPSPAPSPAPSPSFHDLNPANYTPAHESRRRNAEQRAATLRADSLIAEVEPNRVFCSLCQKWVQLRQDSSYCAYPWLQHRGKCLARHQRRAAKAAEVAEAKARKLGHVSSAHPPTMHPASRPARSLSAELESEDDARRLLVLTL